MANNSSGNSPGAAGFDLTERLKAIIRRDLKLGPDIAITGDMPFFGTDTDVDSLDILLLLTSIEKEFGVKVPNEKVGQEIFENVATLAAFIGQQLPARPAAGAGSGASSDQPVDYLKRLPHGESFRFVSNVTSVTEGQSAEAVWEPTGREPFFAGHFPGKPIVPGVLLAEALAQVSGLALSAQSGPVEGRLAHVDVRFERAVEPPARIVLKSKLLRMMGTLSQFEVEASVGSAVVARGTVALSSGPVALGA
jgi:3-hydroxyacyl-[acyl-carrier-protein] dehydratase